MMVLRIASAPPLDTTAGARPLPRPRGDSGPAQRCRHV